ncbi:hypothetical protein [Tissierella praeacuta]|uniref:hypothetical protein n=1 Tax=Tissierella praeacuta TaxID=43131 RepID=UPI0028A9646F|nr:hypothetical protein [Tissierella praeacuta]
MTKVYACLVGNWVCLNDDPDCKMGVRRTSPYIWWEESADIWSPFKKEEEHTMYQMDYVDIIYKNAKYRVNPIFIQIVES